jgi:hypothetical protein
MALFSDRPQRNVSAGPSHGELYAYLNRLLDICERAPAEVGAGAIERIDELHAVLFSKHGVAGARSRRLPGARFVYQPELVASALRKLPVHRNGFPWAEVMDQMRSALADHPHSGHRAEALALLDKLDRGFVLP